jgi:hypothetical protein
VDVDHRQRERAPADLAPAASRTAPSSTTQTSHDVPPMSKHSRSRSPVWRASSAAARRRRRGR